jgi:HEAT repeat protein
VSSLSSKSAEEVLQALRGTDGDRRIAAMAELSLRAKNGDLSAVSPLIVALDVPSPDGVRIASVEWEYCVESLERVGRAAIDQLLNALADKNRSERVRSGAARALGNMGDSRATQPLIAIIQDVAEDLGLRRVAAFYVGRTGDRGATRPLISLAQDTKADLMLRRNAILGLEWLSDADSFDALVSLLHDPDVANMASSAVQSMKDARAIDRLLPTLASDDDLWRQHVAAIVGKVGEEAIEPLLALLGSPDWRLRSGAASALGFTQDPRSAVPLTALGLHDPDSRVRREAANSLGFQEDPSVADTLMTVLDDEDVLVRQAAMASLFHLAMTGRTPTDILPRVEWIAAHDPGTVQGHAVVRDAAERVARELGRAIKEESDQATPR